MSSNKATQKELTERYNDFKSAFRQDITSLPPGADKWRFPAQAVACVRRLTETALDMLADCPKESLVGITGKEYYMFRRDTGGVASRCVNRSLFDMRGDSSMRYLDTLVEGPGSVMTADSITRGCYTIAMSFCAANDLVKERDQKTPGTYFEYLMGLLFSIHLRCIPQRSIRVLSLDGDWNLPTDFIFDTGFNQPKFHVPVKISTRERVIQVWAHQRVIDGVYGMGRFLGCMFCLSETKKNVAARQVTEICIPEQWKTYQSFIATMSRIYYLDLPEAYERLNHVFPPICVRGFGELYFEQKPFAGV